MWCASELEYLQLVHFSQLAQLTKRLYFQLFEYSCLICPDCRGMDVQYLSYFKGRIAMQQIFDGLDLPVRKRIEREREAKKRR